MAYRARESTKKEAPGTRTRAAAEGVASFLPASFTQKLLGDSLSGPAIAGTAAPGKEVESKTRKMAKEKVKQKRKSVERLRDAGQRERESLVPVSRTGVVV